MKIIIDRSLINNSDINKYGSFVPSAPELFSKTIKENINIGSNKVDDSSYLKWVELLGADNLIKSLEDGYDTVVAEKGENISGGQRQLIAILRALVSDSEIVVMDEPFSSLDKQNEEKLLRMLSIIKKHRIVVFTSHRKDTSKYSDVIYYIKEGKLIECHAESK